MILGLDVSTRTVGYSVVNGSGQVLLHGFIDLSEYSGLMDKTVVVRNILAAIPYDIETVMIEKSLLAFSNGASSAKTLQTLSAFNGIISWVCYELFATEPEYISATTARSMLGIKIPKGTKAKEAVMSWVMANVPSFVPAKTKTGSIKKECYDSADAIIVSLASHKLGEAQ